MNAISNGGMVYRFYREDMLPVIKTILDAMVRGNPKGNLVAESGEIINRFSSFLYAYYFMYPNGYIPAFDKEITDAEIKRMNFMPSCRPKLA